MHSPWQLDKCPPLSSDVAVSAFTGLRPLELDLIAAAILGLIKRGIGTLEHRLKGFVGIYCSCTNAYGDAQWLGLGLEYVLLDTGPELLCQFL